MKLIFLGMLTMIGVSETWLDPKRARRLLESWPLLAGMLPVLQSARDELVRVSTPPPDLEQQLQALSDHVAALNDRFDDACRRFHAVMSGYILLCDEKERARFEDIREALIPGGLSCVLLSYFDKFGAVELAASRLTSELRETLTGIQLNDNTALQLFNDWEEAGQALRSAVQQRDQLAQRTEKNQVTRGTMQEAKQNWVRVAKALVSLLELKSDIPEEVRNTILKPLTDAEERQAKKLNQKKKNSGPKSKADDDSGDSKSGPPKSGTPKSDDGDGNDNPKPDTPKPDPDTSVPKNDNTKPPASDGDADTNTGNRPGPKDEQASEESAV